MARVAVNDLLRTHGVSFKGTSMRVGGSTQPYAIASRWRYHHYSIMARKCLKAGTLIKHVKFGEDWTMHSQITTTSCFL